MDVPSSDCQQYYLHCSYWLWIDWFSSHLTTRPPLREDTQRRMVWWLCEVMNWRGCRRKRYYTSIWLEGPRKTTKRYVKTAGLGAHCEAFDRIIRWIWWKIILLVLTYMYMYMYIDVSIVTNNCDKYAHSGNYYKLNLLDIFYPISRYGISTHFQGCQTISHICGLQIKCFVNGIDVWLHHDR